MTTLIYRAAFTLVFIFLTTLSFGQSDSWEKVRESKKGEITIHWFVSTPFIYTVTQNELAGIEYELMQGFKAYLKNKYKIDLILNWQNGEGFKEMYEYIKLEAQPGEFGLSAFSITTERQKEVLFTIPYMLDVAVLVSTNNLPIINSEEEFKRHFNNQTAISVENTTYEKGLNELKKRLNLNFAIKNIPSEQTILGNLLAEEGSFAYLDLPLYLISLKNNPSAPIIRQNLFPMKGKGYAVIMPKSSDWAPILNEYLASDYFQSIHEDVIEKYLEKDIYNIIRSISTGENVNADELIILLTKEKEIQSKELLEKALKIQQNNLIQIVLILGIAGSLIGLMLYYRLYLGKKAAVQDLEKHKGQIEHQQLKIEQANAELLSMNEEKNNLIRVLAHDLRSPINQVAGLAEILLFDKSKLDHEQLEIIQQIINSSNRLREMISKILDVDAIESRQMNIKMENVFLEQVFQDLKHDFEPSANKKHIKLLFSIEDNLCVLGDEVFINQILGNLISNALKFSSANSQVTVSAASHGSDVVISVNDNGPGFTVEDQQNMFKKFQRLSAQPTGGEQSTGLGLSIVKMFTELLEGEISFKSKVGEGTTFILKFKGCK